MTDIGKLTKSFDESPDFYPLGYSHDVSLVKLEKNVQVEHNFPGKLRWMLSEEWDDLRRRQTGLRILEPDLSSAESIKSYQKSDASVRHSSSLSIFSMVLTRGGIAGSRRVHHAAELLFQRSK